MDKKAIIEKVAGEVKERLKSEGSGHDWWHIYRVWQMAKLIAKEEEADEFIVELAALLHDIADFKNHGGDTNVGSKVSRQVLSKLITDEQPAAYAAGFCQISSPACPKSSSPCC